MMGRALQLHYGITPDRPTELYQYSYYCKEIPKIWIDHEDNPHKKHYAEINRDKSGYLGKRVILLVRDPRDVVVSLYHQMSKREKTAAGAHFQGPISDFVRSDTGSLRSILEYYRIWEEHCKDTSHVHLVRYEDLHIDAAQQLTNIMAFIGLPQIETAAIRGAVNDTSFQKMQGMEKNGAMRSKKLTPINASDPNSYKTRKGKVGGYREELDQSAIEWIEQEIGRAELKTLGYH
jgi:hypothetical protein